MKNTYTNNIEREVGVIDQDRINQETELVKREFPYSRPKRTINGSQWTSSWHNRKDMVQRISQGCADASRCGGSIENSLREAYTELGNSIGKVIVNGALTAATAYSLHEGSDAGVIFAGAPALYFTYRNLFGKHVMNGYGHYLKEPYFRVIDNLRLAGSWFKIARFQKEGKLSHGTKEFSTADCYAVLGRNFIGGP